MHPVAESIIQNLDPSVYELVVRRALADDSAEFLGTPTWSEIPAPHNDARTLAILRIEGTVRSQDADAPWSSVVKIIDASAAEGLAVKWVDPEKEEAVYEHRLFHGNGLRFRPAHCYLLDRPRPGLKVFWLEDLTIAHGTPFTIPQLKVLARDVGEFNGYHSTNRIDLPFEPASDSYLARWKGGPLKEQVRLVMETQDAVVLERLHANTPPSTVLSLYQALDQLAEMLVGLPHSLSFGDCQPGNLFRHGDETVAIDWAGLTMDPTGVDAGCLIGSAMTWGPECAAVADVEPELFDAYMEGLASAGWTGRPDYVRRGFFGQFSFYLMLICCASTMFRADAPQARRDFLERRFQTPLEDIPDLLMPIIDLAPKYLEEARSLLRRT